MWNCACIYADHLAGSYQEMFMCVGVYGGCEGMCQCTCIYGCIVIEYGV